MLLDRLMVALHHALEGDDDKPRKKINEVYRDPSYYATTRLTKGNKKTVTHGLADTTTTAAPTASEFSPKYDTSENGT